MILYNCINRHTGSSPLLCLKKNQNASRPSEHPPVRGGEMSKRSVRWDLQRLQIHTVFNRARYGTVQWPVLVVIIGAIEPYHNTI